MVFDKWDYMIQLSRLKSSFSVLCCKTTLGTSSRKFARLSSKSEEPGRYLFRCVLKKCPGHGCREYTRGLGLFLPPFKNICSSH